MLPSPRAIVRSLARLVSAGALAATAANGTAACATCMHQISRELARTTPGDPNAARRCCQTPGDTTGGCERCPALDGREGQCRTDAADARILYCAYEFPNGQDPRETYRSISDEACAGQCRGAPGLGCVETSAGPACVELVGCVGGRRFPELPDFVASGPPLGAYFAEMARLEEASVIAFVGLADDLAREGAPRWLIRGCRAAARDEERHARVMTALARRHGWTEEARAVEAARAPQTLAEIHADNAVEGRREAYGAYVAMALARLAPREDRAALRMIARDEARHAALSLALEAWLERVLGGVACASASREATVNALRRAPLDAALALLGADPGAERRLRAEWLAGLAA